MPLNDALLNIGAAAMQSAAAYGSIHTATPNSSGSNAATSARLPITWETAANGDMVVTADLAFTGGAAGGPALYLGFWSDDTAGTWYGYVPLSGDLTFNAAGELTVTDVSVPGTAS